MALKLIHPNAAKDPVVATLVQFAGSNAYISVPNPTPSTTPAQTITHTFTVSPDICSNLCNIVHNVMCYESAQTASGLVTQANLMQVMVDCSDSGSPSACPGAPRNPCSGIDLKNDAANCGQCGAACSTNHIAATCSGGACTGACDAGYSDCNGNKRTDGCEVAILGSDVLHCGACNAVCSAMHITSTCTAGVCDGPCEEGYSDCDNDKQTGGCEVLTMGSDPQNCGGCGVPCAGTCQWGVCKL